MAVGILVADLAAPPHIGYCFRVWIDETDSIVPRSHYRVGCDYPLLLAPGTKDKPHSGISVADDETQAHHQLKFEFAVPGQQAPDDRGLLLKVRKSWHDATHGQQTQARRSIQPGRNGATHGACRSSAFKHAAATARQESEIAAVKAQGAHREQGSHP
jgi:hypothetical protein